MTDRARADMESKQDPLKMAEEMGLDGDQDKDDAAMVAGEVDSKDGARRATGASPRASTRASAPVTDAGGVDGGTGGDGGGAGGGDEVEDSVSELPGVVTSSSKGRFKLGESRAKLRLAAKATGSAASLKEDANAKSFAMSIQGRRGSLDAEADDDGEGPVVDPYVIAPDSELRRNWDLVSVAFIFMNALAIPFWVAFNAETPVAWQVLDVCVDIFFMLDIVLNFRTGYIDDGELVMRAKPIAHNYIRGWLMIDVVATFPYSWVLVPSDEDEQDAATAAYAELPAMIRFVRLVRLVRLMRLFRLSSRLTNVVEMGAVSKTVLRIGKLAFWVTVIAHVSGCFWALIANLEGWGPDSWTTIYGVDPDDIASLYLSGVYYSLATLTTVGYGDVSAHTNGERVFALLLMLVGAVVFAIVVGRMSALAQSMNRGSILQQRVADDVQEMMRYRNLPRDLRSRMRQYYSLYLDNKPFYDEAAIMRELSPALRRDVVMFMNKDLISKVPFLRDADSGFLSEISPLLKPVRSIPGDFIIIAGEVGREMFMLSEGEVEIISREGNIMRILGAGSFFGEIALLEGCRRTVSVRARTNCHMLSLNKEDLGRHLKEFPTFAEGLRLVARARRYGKPDPDLAKLRKAKPPLGKESWADVLPKHSQFLDRARELAESVVLDKKKSNWEKLRKGGSLQAAKQAALSKGPLDEGQSSLLHASATFSIEGRRGSAGEVMPVSDSFGNLGLVGGTDLAELTTALKSMETSIQSGMRELGERMSAIEARLGRA
uniref:Cyclic nucleotide-binding domain-containing protein n=1 Tax=Bicosoecida sp. CB-2014 TaxID=1486930 RepID=A0A7S1CN86_9STRA|mmetsp:Transcript_7048/g.25064  ORF Transcript_7048/g.25064 Transcript_7048/m.25064 type:complete len:773 (+) Transcript_7048:203-2521(+)